MAVVVGGRQLMIIAMINILIVMILIVMVRLERASEERLGFVKTAAGREQSCQIVDRHRSGHSRQR
jgi:hypothetical protein